MPQGGAQYALPHHRRVFAKERQALCINMLADEVLRSGDYPFDIPGGTLKSLRPGSSIAFVDLIMELDPCTGKVNLRVIHIDQDAATIIVLG